MCAARACGSDEDCRRHDLCAGGKRSRVCVSAPCALAPARVASVRAQQPARARGAHYATGETEFFERVDGVFCFRRSEALETAVAPFPATPWGGSRSVQVTRTPPLAPMPHSSRPPGPPPLGGDARWEIRRHLNLGVSHHFFDVVTRGSRLKIDWCFANWMLF